MGKSELITSISEKSGLTKKDSEAFLKAFVESVEECVASGDKLQLVNFGSFEPRKREAHEGHNPKTREVIQVEAKTVPVFHAGQGFKDIVREGNAE